MLQSLKYKVLIVIAALTVSAPVVVMPVQAYATCSGNISNKITQGINATRGSTTQLSCGTGGSLTSGISTLAVKIVNLFSIIVGIVSVIMIIYAGFRYVTSGGESNSISSAKNTLIYAIIGLVVVVLSQLIVHYVLNTAQSVTTPSGL
jgi:hypothetical protein